MRHPVCESRDTQRSACLAVQSLQFHTALLNECWLLIHEMSGMPFSWRGGGEEAQKKGEEGSPKCIGRKTCCKKDSPLQYYDFINTSERVA